MKYRMTESESDELASLAELAFQLELSLQRLESALRLIAAPRRPDGTWNRDREAVRQLAQDALDGK